MIGANKFASDEREANVNTKNRNQKELNTVRRVSATLECLRENGKRATRLALKEIKEIYNSMNREKPVLLENFIRPEALREELYSRYFTYVQRGL